MTEKTHVRKHSRRTKRFVAKSTMLYGVYDNQEGIWKISPLSQYSKQQTKGMADRLNNNKNPYTYSFP